MPDLMEAIEKYAEYLKDAPFHYNKRALLIAIAKNESSFGVDLGPRLEPAYDINGFYFKKSYLLREQYAIYGDAVAKSYGPFQLMYIVCVELGYPMDKDPADLANFDTNTQYAVAYINRRAMRHADRVEDILDAYNSGTSRDENIPTAYIKRGMRHYEEACREYPEA
jgi:hypothetical protein